MSVHTCAGTAVACPGVCHINREPELQMLPLLLLCDIQIHFDAGPSSAHTNIKTHVASDSWSLIKSLAFVIIQNWLKNKGEIHGIKKQVQLSVDQCPDGSPTHCTLVACY